MTVTLSIYNEVSIDVPPGCADPGATAIEIFRHDASQFLNAPGVESIDVVDIIGGWRD